MSLHVDASEKFPLRYTTRVYYVPKIAVVSAFIGWDTIKLHGKLSPESGLSPSAPCLFRPSFAMPLNRVFPFSAHIGRVDLFVNRNIHT